MGLCCEGQGKGEIDQEIAKTDVENRNIQKILLLGSGSSGKSTLFKQLKKIHSISVEDTEDTIKNVRKNLIAYMLKLLAKSASFSEEGLENCRVDIENQVIADHVQAVASYKKHTFEHPLSADIEQVGKSVRALWALPGIHNTFSRRNLFSFPDNMDYFFDRSEAVFRQDYMPSFEDTLRCRVRTTGMTKIDYTYKSMTFSIFDVGGQRNERKKWFHYFDEVSAVVFVAALNAYNSVIFEDETKNAMHESLRVFKEVADNPAFEDTSMVLLLNKNDLFEKVLRSGIGLSVCFSKEKGWDGKQWTGRDYDPQQEKLALQARGSALLANSSVGDTSTDPMLASENEEKCGTEMEEDQVVLANGNQPNSYYDECYEEAIGFVKAVYRDQPDDKTKKIFIHVTTATSQSIINKVFLDVQAMMVHRNLAMSGLVKA